MKLVQRPLHALAKVTVMAGLGLGMVCGLLFLFGRLATPVTAAPLALSVSGNITSDTVWRLSDSPVIVTGTVNVITGTLTISPGVEVRFNSNTELVIQTNGKLVANGTSTQPITFTSNTPPGNSCDWITIRLISNGNSIRHSLIEYAHWGIYIEPFSGGHDISSNTFRKNGLCPIPLSGGAGIDGSPDNTTIADNTFVDNNSAIHITKAFVNSIYNNIISGTNQAAIAFEPSAGGSSNNQIYSNTIHHAGGYGIYMTNGGNNSIRDNTVFSNTAGGLYITGTTGLNLGENLILDNGLGILWDLNNSSAVITRNVICRNSIYLFRNNAAASVTAARNWWGTNNPISGTQIQGLVVITPNIVLSATAGTPSLPANGISTTTLTVSLQGGGETVPARARTITLTTSLGSNISPTVVTLNNSGIATATYTSAITPGSAVITATDICAFQVTSTVTLTAVYNLAITKTTALTWAVPGQVVTYTVQYSNTSNYPASGVIISDTLPALSTFVGDTSGLPRSGSGSGPITWTVGALPAHTGGNFVLTTSLTSTATCNSFITNTVTISGTGGEPILNDNSSSASQQILCGVNLVVVKNDGVGTGDPRPNAAAGEYITYTISVNNLGNQLATNVILSDTLPANTIFNAARSTPGWSLAGGGVYTINLGNLASNGGTVLNFVAQVAPNLSCAITQTVNTATASSNGPEIYPPDNTSNEQTPVVCGSIVQLAKDDNVSCAIPGQLIDYTITATNTGTAPANSLVLTEFLPANTSFQGPVGVWTPIGGNVYTHSIGTLNGSQVNTTGFWVQVATSTTASAITNVVTLQPGGLSFTLTTPISTSAPDLYVIKNDNIELLSTAAAETIARLEQKLGPLPWLEAVKGQGLGSQATSAAPGDVISYTLAFGNAGTSPATNVVISETLPANTTFLGPAYWTAINANTYVYTISTLLPGNGGNLDFRVRVANPFPTGTTGVTNTVQIAGAGLSECDTSNNISREFTRIETVVGSTTIYLPIILKNFPTSLPPTPTPPPAPLAYVSDVKADPNTNQVFVASPRHDWVYVINGSTDTLARHVPVGHGPTGLTVLDSSVFVAHQYGANNWHPGFMAFGVNDTSAHDTDDGGYAGAAPIKTAANSANNSRVYVSNYFDKLAVFDGDSGPPEERRGWVVQKAFQGAYGIDTSTATNRVYLATRDTGELVVFDGNGDRLLQSNYIPTHVKPPQACSLWSVAVNETTGHVFVPCPQLSKVFVLQESQVSVLDLEALGTLEERDGFLALVVSPQAAPWLTDISIPNGTNLGEEGMAVDASTGRVFITNGQNNNLVILQDGTTPAYVTTVAVGTKPQGVDVNPATHKVYVGNTGSNSVTVLNAASPFSVIKTIQLTP